MKFIETFEELKSLPNSTHVYKIVKGRVHGFYIVGTIGGTQGLIVANDASVKDLYFIYEREFKPNTYTIEYNQREVGELMIKQIQEWAAKEIEDITETYLK